MAELSYLLLDLLNFDKIKKFINHFLLGEVYDNFHDERYLSKT